MPEFEVISAVKWTETTKTCERETTTTVDGVAQPVVTTEEVDDVCCKQGIADNDDNLRLACSVNRTCTWKNATTMPDMPASCTVTEEYVDNKKATGILKTDNAAVD